jgi:hypothetical protein
MVPTKLPAFEYVGGILRRINYDDGLYRLQFSFNYSFSGKIGGS